MVSLLSLVMMVATFVMPSRDTDQRRAASIAIAGDSMPVVSVSRMTAFIICSGWCYAVFLARRAVADLRSIWPSHRITVMSWTLKCVARNIARGHFRLLLACCSVAVAQRQLLGS